MCLSHHIKIVPTFYSTGTVPQHHSSTRKITYSSQKLRALNNVNQVGKQMGGEKPKPKIISYNAVATIRKLRISRKPIRSRHDRFKWHKPKGINRNNLQDIFISEDIILKPNTQCKIGTINAHSIKNKDTFLTQELAPTILT